VEFLTFSYRHALEIIEHEKYRKAWAEIVEIVKTAPLFIYPSKSSKNKRLDVVQQVMNTYFDRRFSVDFRWQHHPLATRIKDSALKADYRKEFAGLGVQAEVQLGNMSRWYSDVFKFQTAYSQRLVQLGLSIVPTLALATRIDSNVVNYERALRELPSAELSITLPILLIGLVADERTPVIDLSKTRFGSVKEITGQGKDDNRWRIVNSYVEGIPIQDVGPDTPTGPTLESSGREDEDPS
jgi:hypothetical protein